MGNDLAARRLDPACWCRFDHRPERFQGYACQSGLTHRKPVSDVFPMWKVALKTGMRTLTKFSRHTYNRLRLLSPGCSQSKPPKVVFGLGRESIQPGF